MQGVIFALIMAAFFAAFVVYEVRNAINGNRDYAYRHPDDPFSQGVDEAWKGKGPPPSEQTFRAGRIRRDTNYNSVRSIIRGATPLPPQIQAQITNHVEADLRAGDAIRAARHNDKSDDVPPR